MACERCDNAARSSYGRRLERRADAERLLSRPAVVRVMGDRGLDGALQRDLCRVVSLEWEQFDMVRGMDGRAGCQDDPRRFLAYRCAQYLAFPHQMIPRVLAELERAELEGRNLVEEKYARMMAVTDPDAYRESCAQRIPEASPVKRAALAQLRDLLLPALADAARDLPESHLHARPDVSSAGRVSSMDYFLAEVEGYSLGSIFALRDALAHRLGHENPIESSWELAVGLLGAMGKGA